MSRLDINIRRLEAQRACLNRVAEQIRDLPGPVLELGLGNGRTYDHLRELLPEREIFVFERDVAAHPDCIPDDDHLYRGDFQDTLPGAAERFAGQVALVHADIGSANLERDAATGQKNPAFGGPERLIGCVAGACPPSGTRGPHIAPRAAPARMSRSGPSNDPVRSDVALAAWR